MLPSSRGMKAKYIMKAMTIMDQMNKGMRLRDSPGARVLSMEAMSTGEATMAATLAMVTPSNHTSMPGCGENALSVSGTYAVQPASGTVRISKPRSKPMNFIYWISHEDSYSTLAIRNVQNTKAVRRGHSTSRAPIMNG